MASDLTVALGTRPRAAAPVRRVALILQSTSLGGMETHCADLAVEYVRRGLDVVAVVPDGQLYDDLSARIGASSASVLRLRTDATAGRLIQIRDLLRLARILWTWRADVVHLHTGGATGGFATVVVARALTRVATVVTEHDVPSESPRIVQRLMRTAMDRSADAIVAVSRRNAALRRHRITPPEHKLAAVLNGVPTADIPPADARRQDRRHLRAELAIDSDRLVIGSLVRLAEGKGLHDLMRAFAIVREDHVATLLLVGDGPLRSELEELAGSLGVRADVRFAGHQRNATRYLDAMDVFVLAVPAGSMSMALLESMARGLPSVITYCGPEEPVIDGQTGMCAPPSDPQGLARILARMSGDPGLRTRLGAAAEEYVRSNFSVQRVADDLLEIYSSGRTGNLPLRLRAGLNVASTGPCEGCQPGVGDAAGTSTQ